MAIKNLVVFGYGFVGSTIADWLRVNTEHTVTVVDPAHFKTDPQEAVVNADGVIIAVPTPSMPNGDCDDSIIRGIIDLCDYRTHILIKSTVTYDLLEQYDPNVVYSPEFLRQNYAKQDFDSQKFMVFGNHKNAQDESKWWIDIFADVWPNIEYVQTDRHTASLVKYVHNSWLATKVVWFHQLSQALPDGISHDELTNILSLFPNVGPSHMKAPNEDGGLGYGGACFPKDVDALLKVLDHSLLRTVKQKNTELTVIKQENINDIS